MADSFAERFTAARARYGPLVLGADPHAQVLADWGLPDDADGLERFTDIVLAAADGTVGLVKPQSAFYERHGWQGIRALTRLTETARAQGLLVILDVKRGDVGSTNAAYAQAYVGEGAPIQADAITVHPYLGLAATGDFTGRAAESGAAVLVGTNTKQIREIYIFAAVLVLESLPFLSAVAIATLELSRANSFAFWRNTAVRTAELIGLRPVTLPVVPTQRVGSKVPRDG